MEIPISMNKEPIEALAEHPVNLMIISGNLVL